MVLILVDILGMVRHGYGERMRMAINSIKKPKIRVKTTLEWIHNEIVLIAQDMAKLAEFIAQKKSKNG